MRGGRQLSAGSWQLAAPPLPEARPKTTVPPAGGSCEPRSRRETEVDALPSSTPSNDEIGHTTEGQGRVVQ